MREPNGVVCDGPHSEDEVRQGPVAGRETAKPIFSHFRSAESTPPLAHAFDLSDVDAAREQQEHGERVARMLADARRFAFARGYVSACEDRGIFADVYADIAAGSTRHPVYLDECVSPYEMPETVEPYCKTITLTTEIKSHE